MGRWIVNILAALSAILFVGIVVLWVRSYWVQEELLWWSHDRLSENVLIEGDGCVAAVQTTSDDRSAWEDRREYYPHGFPAYKAVRPPKLAFPEDTGSAKYKVIRAMGIFVKWAHRPGVSTGIESHRVLIILHCWLLPPCLPFPWLWLRRTRRERRLAWRKAHGLCLVCGYDLRATPDRCPECGTAPARA